MRATIKHRSVAALMVWTIRRARKSQLVADRLFQASLTFLVISACAGNLVLLFAAVALCGGAAKHLDKIEKRNGRD